jgi:hypothetical protein
VPGKEERAVAHRNGGSTVRRRKQHWAAAFIGGEGAPVGGYSGCGVLQHRSGKGVRKLQENTGIGSSGRSSPGSGGWRRCSAGIREGEWAAGGRRRRYGCGERWGGSGTREEGSERSGDGRTSGAAQAGSERLGGSAAEGERGGKRWGSGRGGATRRGGCRGAWPRLADGARQRHSAGERELMGGRGTVSGGGATNRRGWPVSGRGESTVRFCI